MATDSSDTTYLYGDCGIHAARLNLEQFRPEVFKGTPPMTIVEVYVVNTESFQRPVDCLLYICGISTKAMWSYSKLGSQKDISSFARTLEPCAGNIERRQLCDNSRSQRRIDHLPISSSESPYTSDVSQ